MCACVRMNNTAGFPLQDKLMQWGSEVSGRAEVGIYTCNLCAVLKSCVDYVNKRCMLLLRIMESLEAFIQTGSKHTAITILPTGVNFTILYY